MCYECPKGLGYELLGKLVQPMRRIHLGSYQIYDFSASINHEGKRESEIKYEL